MSDSILADFGVMFAGVFCAQWASNYFENRRARTEQRERSERLREQMSYDLQFAMTSVKNARKFLVGYGKAPELHVPPGTLASHLYEVREICMGDTARVPEFMIALEGIKLLNKRLLTIEDLELRGLGKTPESMEHKAQLEDAVKKTESLEARLESLLTFVDPESAKDWRENNGPK